MKKILTLSFVLLFTLNSVLFSQGKDLPGSENERGEVEYFYGGNPYGNAVTNQTDANNDGVGLTTVLKSNNSTSINARAPQGSKRFNNCRYLINGTEMNILGYSPVSLTSIGWTWNNPIGAGNPTNQGATTTGNLRVYMKDTSGAATTISGTFIDTNGTGFIKVMDGTIVIPTGFNEISVDVPFGGPGTSPYTYTPGNAVIVIYVYRTTDVSLAAANTPTVSCRNSGGNIFTYASTTVPGDIGATSTFRPETRFGISPSPSCDIRTVANLFPYTGIEECAAEDGPQARFQNVGSSTQTNISVTYRKHPLAPGPAYNSTKIILSLDPGEYEDVTFDPLTVTGGFDYQIFAYIACDENTANDTIAGFYTLSTNRSYGLAPILGYYFANNTYCGSFAGSTPVYFWEDTTGSTSLAVDGVNSKPLIYTGSSLDDGYWSLGDILPPGDYFRFDGADYDSFFISTNGMIGLTRLNGNGSKLDDFGPLSIPSTSAIYPGLFPLWKDFDLTAVAVPVNRVSYKVNGTKLIITFDRMPNFGAVLPTDCVSFQVILEVMPGPTADGLMIYQYSDEMSGNTFIGKYKAYNLASHTVGIQNNLGTLAIQYRRFSTSLVTAGPIFNSPIAVAFGKDNAALPVELTSFLSVINGSNVTLNWITSREVNNSGFEVERAEVNGQTSIEWKKVGFVNGNGNTLENSFYQFTDRGLIKGKYNYRLKQIDFNGNFEYHTLSNEVIVGFPENFSLSQNYPNPFNPSTKINYDLPFDANVSLKVFDMTGREVITLVNEFKASGYYVAEFNASNLSTGVYLYRISADANGQKFTSEKRMVLVK